jgi:hypothetical protein
VFATPPASAKGVQSNSVLSSKFLPTAGTNAAFDFMERRHVPVAAQRYANCLALDSDGMSPDDGPFAAVFFDHN